MSSVASASPTAQPTRKRRNVMSSTSRELNTLIGQVLARLEEMSEKIDGMLPREIYEVRHGQIVIDTQELAQRLSASEKAIVELNAQLASARIAATQQISTGTREVEQQISDTRHEMVNKIYDLVKSGLILVAGAVLTYIAYHH